MNISYEQYYQKSQENKKVEKELISNNLNKIKEENDLNAVLKKFNITYRDGTQLEEDNFGSLQKHEGNHYYHKYRDKLLFNIPLQDNDDDELTVAVLSIIRNNGVMPCLVFNVPHENAEVEINKFKERIRKFFSQPLWIIGISISVHYKDNNFYEEYFSKDISNHQAIKIIHQSIDSIYEFSNERIEKLQNEIDIEIYTLGSTDEIKTKIQNNDLRLLLINPQLLQEKYNMKDWLSAYCIKFKQNIHDNYKLLKLSEITNNRFTNHQFPIELIFDLKALKSPETNMNDIIHDIINKTIFIKITIIENEKSKTFEIYDEKRYNNFRDKNNKTYNEYVTSTIKAINNFIEEDGNQPNGQNKSVEEKPHGQNELVEDKQNKSNESVEEKPHGQNELVEDKQNESNESVEEKPNSKTQKESTLTGLKIFMMVIILILLCLLFYSYKQIPRVSK